MKSTWRRILVGTVTLAAGAMMIWDAWIMTGALKTRGWVRTDAQILYSKLEASGDKSHPQDDRLRWPSKTADIAYRYSAGGADFRGDHIYYEDLPTSGREAGALAGLFLSGQDIAAYYNPKNPSEAVLITGASGAMLRILVGASAVFFAGLLIITRNPRTHSKDYPPRPH